MIILTKSVMIMMISFILSICISIILIPALKNLKCSQRLSIYLEKSHKQKKNIPTMGGLIFIIPTLFVMLLLFFTKK